LSIFSNNENIKSLSSKHGTPLYVYDAALISENITKIKSSFKYGFVDVHFALMCNLNPHLLNILRDAGIKAFVCSPGELFVALRCGFKPQDIIVSGTGFTDKELKSFIETGVQINIESLSMLERYGQFNPGSTVGIRINFDFGREFPCRTHSGIYWGTANRMGIWEKDIYKALEIARKGNIRIIGLHQYSGTNILDYKEFIILLEKLFGLTNDFVDLEYIDIGGGFGIDYENSHEFSWADLGIFLDQKMKAISDNFQRNISLKMEPGRSIIASSGILVGEIVDIKEIDDTIFLVTNLSLSNFIRPYLYNAYHKTRVVSKRGESADISNKICQVSGNTVAVNDLLARNRKLSHAAVGDLILIEDAGAYGYSMSSHFCGRIRPAEVLVKSGEDTLIRRREEFENLLYGT
jgi:diaminopimelate decarboxylase